MARTAPRAASTGATVSSRQIKPRASKATMKRNDEIRKLQHYRRHRPLEKRTGFGMVYTPEMDEQARAFMAEGYSRKALAGLLNVSELTITNWIDEKHPQYHDTFAQAFWQGTAQGLAMWEKIGIDLSTGKIGGNARAWEINMAARYGWFAREKEATVNVNLGVVALPEVAKLEDPKPVDAQFIIKRDSE